MIRAGRLALPTFVVAAALTPVAVAAPKDAPKKPAPAAAPSAAAPAAPATAPAAAPPPTAAAPSTAATPAPATAPAATPPSDPPPAAAPTATATATLDATAAAAPPAADAPSDAAATPGAEPSSGRSSLEIALAFGPTVVGGEPANPEFDPSLSRVGVFGELGVAYRSSYFIDPYIGIGYAALARGEAHLPAGEWGAAGTLKQSLGAWTISPGLTADIWRFRPRLGIGIALVKQGYSFAGQDTTATQTPLVTQLGLGFVAHNGPRFRLDIEARAVIIAGAEVNFGTLDLILRGDAVYFGGS